jgi:hypothetical protein
MLQMLLEGTEKLYLNWRVSDRHSRFLLTACSKRREQCKECDWMLVVHIYTQCSDGRTIPRDRWKRVYSHKGMVRSDTSKPAMIFFLTARVHTTKSTIKILAANTHCKHFFFKLLNIANIVTCQTLGEMFTPSSMQNAIRLIQPRRMLQRWRHETAQRIVQTSGTSGSAYRKNE